MELSITVYLNNKNEDIIADFLVCKPSIGDGIMTEMGTFIVTEVLHFVTRHTHTISVWVRKAKKQR